MSKIPKSGNSGAAPDTRLSAGSKTADIRFRKLIENSQDGLTLLDKELQIIYRSASAERINGWNETDRAKYGMDDLLHPDDRATVKYLLNEVLASPGVSKTSQFRSRHFKGHYIWVECVYTNFINDPDINAIVCNFRDITQQKHDEELLQQTVKELFAYQYALDESAIVAVTDQKGIIKHVNDNFCKISKYSEAELIGQDHRIINSGYHDKAFIRDLWVTIAKGNIWKGELKNKAKDGSYYWVDTTIVPFLNEEDKPYQYVAIRSDITAKKQSEEQLEQTIKELLAYQYALDESAIVAITDQKGIITHVNGNFCRISKYSEGELIGQDHRIINSGFHSKAFIRNLWVTIANGEIWKGELKNKAKDGSYYWVDTTIVPFLNEQGKPYQYVAIRSDITERKLHEEKIIENELFIKTITDSLPAMIAYWDAGMNCLFANKPYMQWFEKQPHEILGVNKRDILDKKEFEVHELHIRDVLDGVPQRFERTFHKPDGRAIDTDTQYLPDIQNGSVKGFYSLIYDVTEIKYAEKEVKKKTEQIENILESITDGFIAIDSDMRYTYGNKRIEAIFGVPVSAILGKTLLDIFPGAVETQTYTSIKKALNEKIPVSNEDYYAPLNLWTENRIFPAQDGVSIFIRDITDRKKAEASAIEALEERNTILESIDDAFFAVDKNWVVTYWNNKAAQVLMTDREKILNQNLWEVFSGSLDSESYKKYHEAIETNQAAHFEDYFEPLNRWYEISAYPSDTGLSVYFKDITERKTSEIRLKDLNESLQKQAKELGVSNAELEQFAYVASHDLQEPLRMVTSFLSQLEKKYSDMIDDKGRQYINFAVDGAKRMRQIILDLLDFSRVGRTEDDLEDVDFNKMMDEILALYRRQIEEVRAEISIDHLPVIQTYKTPVRQIFQNLIGNSLKYHTKDGVPAISISCKEIKTHFQFSVKDNGIGIAPVYFERIFVIFQRLHNKDEYSGTGMGLALAKKIVENMGGKIWVKSAEGKGSTFYFTLLKNNRL